VPNPFRWPRFALHMPFESFPKQPAPWLLLDGLKRPCVLAMRLGPESFAAVAAAVLVVVGHQKELGTESNQRDRLAKELHHQRVHRLGLE